MQKRWYGFRVSDLMKKITTIGCIVLLLYACTNNDSKPSEQNNTQSAPVNTDSGTTKGDTAMYQRMPNKTNDSMPE
jgi:hypothetical protein